MTSNLMNNYLLACPLIYANVRAIIDMKSWLDLTEEWREMLVTDRIHFHSLVHSYSVHVLIGCAIAYGKLESFLPHLLVTVSS